MKITIKVEHLAATLKSIRRHANYSQREVAYRLGFKSPVSISNYERGAREPSLESVERMLNLYGYEMRITITKRP